jgi:hypothetical protein
MNGHHLILGKLEDTVTGEIIEDTHDERYRQKVASLLIHRKGYLRDDIEPRRQLLVQAGDKRAVVRVDFVIHLENRISMIIKYGPGSLVTRHRPLLAASRILAPYQIPVAVITNGEGAEILDGPSAKILGRGLESIPSKTELGNIATVFEFSRVPTARAELESRILYCFEVDDSCPCDTDICRV